MIIDNDAQGASKLKKRLIALGEQREIDLLSLMGDIETRVNDADALEKIELVLTDLELDESQSSRPGDFSGRDLVLRAIRRNAPWIPIVLFSRFIHTSQVILGELTPLDFDAVLDRDYFSDPTTNGTGWRQFVDRVRVHRIACLTGRSCPEVAAASSKPLEIECGSAVQSELDAIGDVAARESLRLLGIPADKVLLDLVAKGYSGLSVFAASAMRSTGRESRWLLKCGRQLRKLHLEAAAHRKMFEDGFTRRLSVPLFWSQPVIAGDVGILAYEFEDGAKTLQEFVRAGADSVMEGLRRMATTMERFYLGNVSTKAVPGHTLSRLLGKVRDKPSVASALAGDGQGLLSGGLGQQSLSVMRGVQHGDLHSRNVLIGTSGTVLIDFAHYVDVATGGYPLLDVAKLIVDLAGYETVSWTARDLVASPAEIVSGVFPFLFLNRGVPTDDEREFLRLACITQMMVYLTYGTLSTEVHQAFVDVL